MDVYIVLDGARVVDVSARLQGAELIRAAEAARIADARMGNVINPANREMFRAQEYANLRIVNADVKDMD